MLEVGKQAHKARQTRSIAEEVGHKKSNLGAGQRKLAGSFAMAHRS